MGGFWSSWRLLVVSHLFFGYRLISRFATSFTSFFSSPLLSEHLCMIWKVGIAVKLPDKSHKSHRERPKYSPMTVNLQFFNRLILCSMFTMEKVDHICSTCPRIVFESEIDFRNQLATFAGNFIHDSFMYQNYFLLKKEMQKSFFVHD